MPRSYGVTNAAPWASAPTVGPAGDTYFNTASKTLFVSDGTSWIAVGGSTVTYQEYTKTQAISSWGTLTGGTTDTTNSVCYAAMINGRWIELYFTYITTTALSTSGVINGTAATLVAALRPNFTHQFVGLMYPSYTPLRVQLLNTGIIQPISAAAPPSGTTQIWLNCVYALNNLNV